MCAIALTADPQPPGKGRIIKWVDENGVTHYGDSLPHEYANKPNTILDGRGLVVKKNETGQLTPKQQEKNGEQRKIDDEQLRHDTVLLATYSNEKEIDLSRDRNLEMENAAILSLQSSLENVQKKLTADKKSAAELQARKKPLPDDLKQNISASESEIASLQQQITQKRVNSEEIRKRFEADKLRFRELRLGMQPAATAPHPKARP